MWEPTELTVDVRLWPVNDAPEVVDQQSSVTEEGRLTLNGAELLSQASDSEGDAVRIVGVWRASNGQASF